MEFIVRIEGNNFKLSGKFIGSGTFNRVYLLDEESSSILGEKNRLILRYQHGDEFYESDAPNRYIKYFNILNPEYKNVSRKCEILAPSNVKGKLATIVPYIKHLSMELTDIEMCTFIQDLFDNHSLFVFDPWSKNNVLRVIDENKEIKYVLIDYGYLINPQLCDKYGNIVRPGTPVSKEMMSDHAVVNYSSSFMEMSRYWFRIYRYINNTLSIKLLINLLSKHVGIPKIEIKCCRPVGNIDNSYYEFLYKAAAYNWVGAIAEDLSLESLENRVDRLINVYDEVKRLTVQSQYIKSSMGSGIYEQESWTIDEVLSFNINFVSTYLGIEDKFNNSYCKDKGLLEFHSVVFQLLDCICEVIKVLLDKCDSLINSVYHDSYKLLRVLNKLDRLPRGMLTADSRVKLNKYLLAGKMEMCFQKICSKFSNNNSPSLYDLFSCQSKIHSASEKVVGCHAASSGLFSECRNKVKELTSALGMCR